jgi:hypothetical protein
MAEIGSGAEKRRGRKRRARETGLLRTEGKSRDGALAATNTEGGAERLQEAADQVVRAHCDELAGALMDAALGGDVSCVKILVSLSDRQREERKEREAARRAAAGKEKRKGLLDFLEEECKKAKAAEEAAKGTQGGVVKEGA